MFRGFSPDGKLIAFAVISSSDVSLYLMDTDGNNKREVSISGGSLGTYEWIDNNRILYDAGTETKLSVGIVDVSSGNSTIIAEEISICIPHTGKATDATAISRMNCQPNLSNESN